MAPLPRDEFLAALGGLDGDRFAAFVAAVWRARGFEVSREGRTLRADDGEDTRLVHARRRTRWLGRTAGEIPDGADTVVTNTPGTPAGVPPGARVVDAGELYDLVLYGIGREDADGICREFLDRPATVAREPDRQGGLPVGARDPGTVAVAAIVVLLVAAGLVGAFEGIAGPAEGGEGSFEPAVGELPFTEMRPTPIAPGGTIAADGGGDAAADARDPRENVHSPGIGTATAAGDRGFPPGLGPGGVIDAAALAGGHAEALSGRSYRLVITYRESIGGRPAGLARERVRVAGPTVHASAVERFGRTRFDRTYVGGSAYANGSHRIVRNAGGRRVVPLRPGVYVGRVERYLAWFLSVERSRVIDRVERDGRTLWLVALGDDPWPGVENATGTAVVDDRGIVRSVRRSYDAPDSNVSVTVSIRYPQVGGVTVEAPGWYSGNGTVVGAGTSVRERPAGPADAGRPRSATPRTPDRARTAMASPGR